MNTLLEDLDFATAEPIEVPRTPAKAPKKRSRVIALVAGVGLLVALGTAGAVSWLGGSVSTDDAQVDGHLVTISPKVGGHIVKVLVDDNQHVKAGDLLALIDDRDFQARVDQARAALAQAVAGEQQVAVRSADLSTAQAHVEAARANLEAAQLQLGYTRIAAPVNGVVTRKSVELGQLVQPGQGLLVLVPLNDVWVTANFKETQLAGVRPGQRAEVKVDTYGRTVTGRVDSIAGATGSRLSLLPPENATGNFVKVVQRIPVKIVLNAADLQQYPLRVGMNVEASIETH